MKNVIYQIVNLINNKRYIGSTKSYKKRRNEHLSTLRHNCHDNQHLQNSYNKYGKKNFILEIIDTVPYAIELLDREYYWWSKYDFETELYNICPVPGSPLGRACSEETKEKMSVAMLGENNPNFGKPLSKEHRDKISTNSPKVWLGKKRSKEAIENMRNAKKNKKPVVQIDPKTNDIIATFESIAEAARIVGCHKVGISAVCNGLFVYNKGKPSLRQIAGGYKWKFVSDLPEKA